MKSLRITKLFSSIDRQLLNLFLLISFLLPAQLSSAQTIDKIIAIVNDEIITQSEVSRVLSTIEAEYKSLYSDPRELEQKLKEAKKNIVNQMIEEKLVLCAAKEYDIKADEDIVEARIEQIKEGFPSEQAFEMAIQMQQLSLKDLRDRFRNQEIMRKAVEYFVRFDIKVDHTEIKNFYQEHQQEFVKPERAMVANILIKVDESCDEYQALQKAGMILQRLSQGDSFEDLAKSYSQGINAEEGGEFGLIERGQLLKELDEAIFSLNPGEFTDALKTQSGYHIFKVLEKEPEHPLGFPEAQDTIRKTLYNRHFSEAFKEWINQLKQNAYISIKGDGVTE